MANKKKSKTKAKVPGSKRGAGVHPEQTAQVVVAISEHFERVIARIVWTILVALVIIAGFTATGVMMVLWAVVLHH